MTNKRAARCIESTYLDLREGGPRRQILTRLKVSLVTLCEARFSVTLTEMITSTSAATSPVHGSSTCHVCTWVGTLPWSEMFSTGDARASGLLTLMAIEYGNCNKNSFLVKTAWVRKQNCLYCGWTVYLLLATKEIHNNSKIGIIGYFSNVHS